MAVSLATRLTPYMGSGGIPKVVITGRFVLGMCTKDRSSSRVFVAPYLDMRRAFYPVVGTVMSVRVSGRCDGLNDYDSSNTSKYQSGIGAAGVNYGPNHDTPMSPSDISNHEVFQAANLGEDYPFLVRMFTAGTLSGDDPNVFIGQNDGEDHVSSVENAESELRSRFPKLGESCSEGSTVTIELTGRLGNLDLSVFRAAAVFRYNPNDNNDVYRTFMYYPVRGHNYGISGAGGYKYTGWFLDHVDVYDQQRLRGLVTGADGKITWH